jgi:hypothetical protein
MAMPPAPGTNQLCAICAQTRAWQLWDSLLNLFTCANCWNGLKVNHRGGANGGLTLGALNFGSAILGGASWPTVLAITGTESNDFFAQKNVNPSLSLNANISNGLNLYAMYALLGN